MPDEEALEPQPPEEDIPPLEEPEQASTVPQQQATVPMGNPQAQIPTFEQRAAANPADPSWDPQLEPGQRARVQPPALLQHRNNGQFNTVEFYPTEAAERQREITVREFVIYARQHPNAHQEWNRCTTPPYQGAPRATIPEFLHGTPGEQFYGRILQRLSSVTQYVDLEQSNPPPGAAPNIYRYPTPMITPFDQRTFSAPQTWIRPPKPRSTRLSPKT